MQQQHHRSGAGVTDEHREPVGVDHLGRETFEHGPGEFSEKVAGFYESRGLPRFYVMTLFREVDRGSFYVGGEPADNTVRVAIDHIAREAGDAARRKETRKRIATIIEPFASAKGLYWEYHVDHTPNDLWMIEGFVPPPANSDGEKLWAKENRAIPYGD